MTTDQPDPTAPDDPADPADSGGPEERSAPGPKLDVDAAFAEIVAHWEPSAAEPDRAEPPAASERHPAPYPGTVHGLVTEPVGEDHEDHFVPPPPPPLPVVEPRRKLAWGGLLGAPLLALVLIVLGVVVPGWMALLLVGGFVGGFGYLVATMGPSPADPWSGDDGAVL